LSANTVLLVEDDELNRKLVRTLLARSADPSLRDVRLLEAVDLAQARAVLAAGPVDAVLLDMNLPHRSGFVLAEELRLQAGPPSTIIAMTGAGDQQRAAALAAGCAAALSRPYIATEFCDVLAAHLTARTSPGQSVEVPERRDSAIPAQEASDAASTGPDGPGPADPALDFRAMFESVAGSYLVLGPDLVITAVSDAYLRDTRTVRTDFIGRSVLEAFPAGIGRDGRDAAAELQASLARVRRDKTADAMPAESYPGQLAPPQGGGFEVRYRSAVNVPVIGPGGHLTGIVHQLRDVTEYVRLNRMQQADLEQRLRQIEADAEVPADPLALTDDVPTSDFVERLGHELRSPLNTIIGFGELLDLGSATAEQREWVAMVLAAARRLGQILDESLDVSRVGTSALSMSMEAVPVRLIIADAIDDIRPLALSRGVSLDPAPEVTATQYVYADGPRLRQVLLNLLSNAVKFNHPAGQVTVTIEPRDGDRLRVNVLDTGRGIARHDIDKLFRPFERLDAGLSGVGGTGLGLKLSRDLITAMGGTAGVTSTPGTGSVFWVELPRTEPVAVSQLAIQDTAIVTTREYSSPKTILYVEDMVENLRLVEQILRFRPSVTLIPAMLAGVALDLARQHHPDLILLDVLLPDMPGDEMLSLLHADPAVADIPVAILTAAASRPQAGELAGPGVAAYLTKPVNVRSLLETVDRVLGESPAEPPAASAAAETTADTRRDGTPRRTADDTTD
jgi:signal transduction histidine kinase/DNA-binding response OmpR family regulator